MERLDQVWEAFIAVLLAMAGGLARMLNKKDKRNLKAGRLAAELFIAAFAGLMMLFFSRAIGVADAWVGLLSGIAGWVGPRAIDMIAAQSGKNTGMNFEKKEKE